MSVTSTCDIIPKCRKGFIISLRIVYLIFSDMILDVASMSIMTMEIVEVIDKILMHN